MDSVMALGHYAQLSTTCIEWQGWRDPAGYGRARFGGKLQLVHRVSYCLANGIPLSAIKGLVIRHRCDNRGCINPNHLEAGTQLDNIRDMVDRGRQLGAPGASNGRSKLTDEQVRQIRSEYVPRSETHNLKTLAEKHGVSFGVIHKVVTRKRWSHV